jgi:hypothetical protein
MSVEVVHDEDHTSSKVEPPQPIFDDVPLFTQLHFHVREAGGIDGLGSSVEHLAMIPREAQVVRRHANEDSEQPRAERALGVVLPKIL